MAPFRFHSIQRVVSHKILLIIRYAFTRTIKKCQKTAMLLHGISDTSYNLRQRMPPAMVFHAGTRTASSYDICLTYITPWQQVRIKINYNAILAQYLVYCQLIATISILLFLLFIKIFQVFVCFCLFTFQNGLRGISLLISIRSLTTEEHTPSWILVPDDGLPAHGMSAVWISSLTEQPKTWPGRA